MIARSHPVHYTFREYIAHDAASNTKHEYLDGQIYAMAGGTPEHAALISSVHGHLWTQIGRTRRRPHMADLRIRVLETGLATYPDIPIVCGRTERDPEDGNTVINPTVIIEVLSESTETYDRGEKFEHYKRIPSLRAYVLVAHEKRAVEVWTRASDDGWDRALYVAGDQAKIDAIGAALEVDAVYEDARERD
jgi:Uma2 family endonuclease